MAGGPGPLIFQKPENAAYGLAAGGLARVVDDLCRIRESVPGEVRQVTRCLFGDGEKRRERGGAPARVRQRPPGVVTGGQPQFRVRGDRERPGGEILDPVGLAGGNGGRRGRYQPAGLVCGVGAEFGRAFQGQRGGGRAAAASRLGRGGLQQRRHLLVRIQGRRRQVPGPPVGLVGQRPGELAVRRGPPRERRGVIDGGTDQGMRELQAGPVDLDQAQLLGRRQGLRAWPRHGRSCRAQVRAVGHRGQQQRGLHRLGQRGEPGGQDRGQPVRQRQRLSGPPPAGPGIIGDHRSQLDQSHRITGRLREHLRPGLPAGRPRLPVQQQAGVPGRQRLQMQLGEAAVKTGGRGLPPGTDQQHHPLGVQPAAREGQRVQRTAVQPVRVIGDHQDRGPFRQIRQQRQDGHPGQQRVRRTGIRRNAQRPQQRLGLPPRQPGGNRQHRPQQLMQPGEREPGLRLPASDRQHPHPRGPRAPGSVGQ